MILLKISKKIMIFFCQKKQEGKEFEEGETKECGPRNVLLKTSIYPGESIQTIKRV